jgi:hypothetical protein
MLAARQKRQKGLKGTKKVDEHSSLVEKLKKTPLKGVLFKNLS